MQTVDIQNYLLIDKIVQQGESMKYLACIYTFLTTANVFALGEINCSSAKAHLKLIDSEFWEYGNLTYSISHPEQTLFQVVLNENSKRWLHINNQNRAYTIEAKVIMRDGSNAAPTYFWLLCEQWSNAARD